MTLSDRTTTLRTTSLGWMIQKLARHVEHQMSSRLDAFGLTVAQFAVLMRVLERDGQAQSEIGAHFAMPAYAVSRAIDGLERAHLVTREPNPASRRAHGVFATDAARDLAPRLHATVRDVNAQLAAPLDPRERADFAEMLTRLVSTHVAPDP